MLGANSYVEGMQVRGENEGEVSGICVFSGKNSGDAEAERSLPAISARNSGDVGEGGPGGRREGATPPAVLRSLMHCSR